MFETPEVVYTDSKFPVIVETDLSGYDINWLISKDNGDSKIYTEYTDFVLNEYGGDIQLLNSGEYTLTLSAVDTTGRKFEYSRNIKVIPLQTLLSQCRVLLIQILTLILYRKL